MVYDRTEGRGKSGAVLAQDSGPGRSGSPKVERAGGDHGASDYERPTRTGIPWTREESLKLIRLWLEGKSSEEIAKLHGRSESAIRSQFWRASGMLRSLIVEQSATIAQLRQNQKQ